MAITKNSLIMMIFFLTIKHCLAKSANSQILIKTIFYFTLINLLMKESSLGISLRFVRIANYPLAALFLCLGGASTGFFIRSRCELIVARQSEKTKVRACQGMKQFAVP